MAKKKNLNLTKFKWIELKYTDLIGNLHRVTLPVSNFDSIMKNGVGFDSSSCEGFKSVEGGDMILMPDLNSAHENFFAKQRTISFFCNIFEADTKKEYNRDPRTIANKAEKYLSKSKIADKVLFGPEFEFYIFDRVKITNKENIAEAKIELIEGNLFFDDNNDYAGEFIGKHKGYHSIEPKERFNNLRNEISSYILDSGIKLIYHHHEVGPGQNEIEIQRIPLVQTGDTTQMIKNIIKNAAYTNGYTATFMPKPLYNLPGSGMHFHQHLFKKNKNLFFNKNGYGGLSKIAEYYIAGLLKHGRALLAFTNPSTNSYKRLIPGFEAPVKLFYSLANRSSAVRIPKYATSEKEKRIEFRPPDATANPYLATAAMLMAGIDGIKNKISLKENNFGPYDMNMEKADNRIKNKIKSCPTTLNEALEALKNDYKFLLAENVFSEDMINAYINYKYNEIQTINERPHPYEFELYY